MLGFAVTLREDGLFEAPSSLPGRSSVRVTCDGRLPASPWVVLALDETGLKWTQIASFHGLDEALNCAVCEALCVDTVQEYTVKLPDGTRFKRPGRIGAEQVMASAGWIFVNSLIGFSMVTMPQPSTVFDARAEMLRRIAGTALKLGEVSLSDQDEEGLHWCADLTLSYEGFVLVAEIEAEAKAAFAAEGVEVIPHFDFRTRTSVVSAQASILPFPEDRIVRKRTAA